MESIMIGHDIKLTVLGVKGNHVRIGVTAPKDISVHRQEIYDTIQKEIADGTHVPRISKSDIVQQAAKEIACPLTRIEPPDVMGFALPDTKK